MPKPYTPNDKWSQRAAAEGYRARSVYKLEELDRKFGLLRRGMTVLDLGAAPGSWLQYAAERVGPAGRVIGIDLQEIAPVGPNVRTRRADIANAAAVEAALREENAERADIVLSDLAPNTSGIRDIDQWRSIELSQAVEAVAERVLPHGAACVMKVLRGADFDAYYAELRGRWRDVKLQHVRASRDRSKEVYIVMRKP